MGTATSTSQKLMFIELSTLGTAAAVAMLAAVTSLGPALLDGPVEAAIALRSFVWIAAACLFAGFRLGIAYIRSPDRLAKTSLGWWAMGWLGAFSMIGILGAWIFQAVSGEVIGIKPDDPPELNPFGGPPQEWVQYILQISSFGVPLLVPWGHLLWVRHNAMRSNPSLERP